MKKSATSEVLGDLSNVNKQRTTYRHIIVRLQNVKNHILKATNKDTQKLQKNDNILKNEVTIETTEYFQRLKSAK